MSFELHDTGPVVKKTGSFTTNNHNPRTNCAKFPCISCIDTMPSHTYHYRMLSLLWPSWRTAGNYRMLSLHIVTVEPAGESSLRSDTMGCHVTCDAPSYRIETGHLWAIPCTSKNRWSGVTSEPPEAFAKPLEALIIGPAAVTRPQELWVCMCHGDYRVARYYQLFILKINENYIDYGVISYNTIYEQRTRKYVKFNAMHKLGSSPIGCEDFSIPRGITNGVSV